MKSRANIKRLIVKAIEDLSLPNECYAAEITTSRREWAHVTFTRLKCVSVELFLASTRNNNNKHKKRHFFNLGLPPVLFTWHLTASGRKMIFIFWIFRYSDSKWTLFESVYNGLKLRVAEGAGKGGGGGGRGTHANRNKNATTQKKTKKNQNINDVEVR